VNVANGTSTIELAWQAGASTSFQLYLNGALSQSLSNLATSASSVASIQLGPQGTLSGITSNSRIDFDNVKVTRTALIGTN
jgi:hypothetical protein